MNTNEGFEVDQKMEDNYLVARNILLKNYQIKLLEAAKKRNTIIYLPTGSGKTLIAVHVLCSRMKDMMKPFNEGGKIAFFVASTKIMAYQLSEVLKFQTKFKVSYFTGDMNVDTWNRNKWISEFENNQVIVLTGEILRLILIMGFINPSDITLIVFDECHHAVADHPYNQILKFLLESTSEKPLLLGLTAVLLNSNPKKDKVSHTIQTLEAAFDGKVITQVELEEILTLASNPTEKLVVYHVENTTYIEDILKICDSFIETLKNMVIKSNNIIPEEGIDFKSKCKVKRIKNGAVQVKRHLEELGVFGGSISALYYIILFEKYRLKSIDEKEIQVLIYARTELNKIRHVLIKLMGNVESSTSIIQFTSSKVKQLIDTVKNSHEKANGKNISTIIFVHQRVTAKVLAYLFKRLSTVGENYTFIKPDYIVGSSMMSKGCFVLNSSNQDIVKRFSSGSVNVLFATNILEEGVDISACNVVISFDFPLSYPSYFQSKGRARDRNSSYYVMVEENEVMKKVAILNSYRNLGKTLISGICEDLESSEEEEDEESEEVEKIYIDKKTGKIVVDGITAIKVVDRYCSKLKQDSFSLLSPLTWYIKNHNNNKKKSFLELPVNCPLREVVEGEWRESKKLAKRSCFLVTLKKLYEMGELDDDLNYTSFKMREDFFDNLFPHYKKEIIDSHLPQPGTKKRNQVYKLKFAECLSNSLPTPGIRAYLHVIELTVAFEKPEIERKIAIYDVLRLPVTFAILSRKKLCKIFRFPLFLDMGQINCDFLVNYDEMILTESEINDIKLCHFALFQKVTKVLKNSQIFDNRNKEHSFFVVPVEKNEEGRFVINWDVIKMDFCRNNNCALVRYNPTSYPGQKRNFDTFSGESSVPAEETSNSLVSEKFMWRSSRNENSKNPKFEFTEAAYKYFVITPNYRNVDPPQYYIVSKFCYDMSPLSPFPRENFAHYFHYYKDKYFIEITNMKQPLLKVSPLFHCSNFNVPRQRKPRRAREKFKEYEELLIPELCDVIPFDRRYWVKALLLPTVLNRIYHVYYVEEYRREIAREMGFGFYELPEGVDWKPLNPNNASEKEEEEEVGTPLTNNSINLETSLPLSKLKDKTQKNTKVILDSERHMYEIGLCDIKFYLETLDELMNVPQTEGGEMQDAQQLAANEILKLTAKKNFEAPALRILSLGRTQSGPDLALMIEVCTAKSANDIVNYERLETLGDSFLKLGATIFLFRNYPENEGILTDIKGKIVGNRNLLYCGLEKGIQNVINVTDFVPSSDWNPPLICVPERLADVIINKNIDPAVLYRLKIPFEEQFSGSLSETTFQMNEEFIKNHNTCWEMPTHSLLPYKSVNDKTVSDCVEAFIGSFLLSSGLYGALEFLLWLGILPNPGGSYSELFTKHYEVSLLESGGDAIVMNLLGEIFYQDLEDTLDYHFKNKALLLEAVTHPSYSKNRITRCYQRLELLGDAVIDFLITTYVYENCGHLTPGQITDIRSSLVNNTTFGCLVVRYELYKYLLSFSAPLSKAIENFVLFQVSRNHVVDDNVSILLNEDDYAIGESILVPKALGDLFESLAGAIFLDSGNSLETVWRVYYRLMQKEIDEFTKTVPKSAVRLLQEICGDKPYYECEVVHEYTKVSCSIYYDNREIKAYGFGSNKKEGKRSAAKLLLNKILALKK